MHLDATACYGSLVSGRGAHGSVTKYRQSINRCVWEAINLGRSGRARSKVAVYRRHRLTSRLSWEHYHSAPSHRISKVEKEGKGGTYTSLNSSNWNQSYSALFPASPISVIGPRKDTKQERLPMTHYHTPERLITHTKVEKDSWEWWHLCTEQLILTFD